MNVRCIRNFWYESMRLVDDEWEEDYAYALIAAGNCVDANWHPTIRPWPVAIPPAPLVPAGP